jgi:hypothetical protein
MKESKMEQNVPGAVAPELTIEQRVAALENQLYVIYLQTNSITKLMLDKGMTTHDELTKEMDDLNQEIFKITAEVMEKVAAESAVEEPVETTEA